MNTALSRWKICGMTALLFCAFMLRSVQSCACDCLSPKFTEKYMGADFVARVLIRKVYMNKGENMFYKSDIVIHDLYKGTPIKSIEIEGSSDGRKRSSCDISLPENTELLVYAREITKRKYRFDSCSGYVILNAENSAANQRELDMLNLLRKRKINYTNKIWFGKRNGFQAELERFKGVQLNRDFAMYEMTMSKNMTVKKVEQIIGFGNEVDDELRQILEKSAWVSSQFSGEGFATNTIPEDSKHLVCFYFYKAGKGHKSFVSEYDL